MWIDSYRHRLSFNKQGYTIVRNAYPVNNHTKNIPDLFDYTKALPLETHDKYSPGTPTFYQNIEICKIQMKLLPIVEAYTGLKLYPTYNYMRRYIESSILKPHTDRPACEISCSLTIGCDGDYVWPLYLLDALGNKIEVILEPGDMLVYKGTVLDHWREDATEAVICQSQAFLHYVDQDGSNQDYIFDLNK